MNGPGQPATDQLLLTDDGNCPQSLAPHLLMRALHAIYADILIPDANPPLITVGTQIARGMDDLAQHCLDDSAHSQLEFMILIDF